MTMLRASAKEAGGLYIDLALVFGTKISTHEGQMGTVQYIYYSECPAGSRGSPRDHWQTNRVRDFKFPQPTQAVFDLALACCGSRVRDGAVTAGSLHAGQCLDQLSSRPTWPLRSTRTNLPRARTQDAPPEPGPRTRLPAGASRASY
jgi:hypothetical protein